MRPGAVGSLRYMRMLVAGLIRGGGSAVVRARRGGVLAGPDYVLIAFVFGANKQARTH